MKITKYGHCCLLIEEEGLKILTDPGSYCATPTITEIDVLLITHEHQDHCHVDAIKEILKANPAIKIISHESVENILSKEGIVVQKIKDGEEIIEKGIPIQSFGSKHACLHHEIPLIQNTGFYINKKLYYPGDSFHNPKQNIEILALPVAGPWMKIEEAIEYAKEVKPRIVFPVHDGMIIQDHRLEPTRRIPKMILEPLNISYVDMREGSSEEF
jgi:L-ascorbate metabolism protein UlaG (beta-lactamase superfamily)